MFNSGTNTKKNRTCRRAIYFSIYYKNDAKRCRQTEEQGNDAEFEYYNEQFFGGILKGKVNIV